VIAALRDTVEKICNCFKTYSGVGVDWMEGNRKNYRHFTHAELAAMMIRIPDLLRNPDLFRIDIPSNRIWLGQVGRGSF